MKEKLNTRIDGRGTVCRQSENVECESRNATLRVDLGNNKGRLVEGNAVVPAGLFFWNGRAWGQLSTVCGGSGEASRIAWAGPDEFWVITEPSEPRVGSGLGLCHFKDGVVVGSYSTPLQSPDPFRPMDAAACNGPSDCWFAGIGSEGHVRDRLMRYVEAGVTSPSVCALDKGRQEVSLLAFARSKA